MWSTLWYTLVDWMILIMVTLDPMPPTTWRLIKSTAMIRPAQSEKKFSTPCDQNISECSINSCNIETLWALTALHARSIILIYINMLSGACILETFHTLELLVPQKRVISEHGKIFPVSVWHVLEQDWTYSVKGKRPIFDRNSVPVHIQRYPNKLRKSSSCPTCVNLQQGMNLACVTAAKVVSKKKKFKKKES